MAERAGDIESIVRVDNSGVYARMQDGREVKLEPKFPKPKGPKEGRVIADALEAFLQLVPSALSAFPDRLSQDPGWYADIASKTDPEKAAGVLRRHGQSARDVATVLVELTRVNGVVLDETQKQIFLGRIEDNIKKIYQKSVQSPKYRR